MMKAAGIRFRFALLVAIAAMMCTRPVLAQRLRQPVVRAATQPTVATGSSDIVRITKLEGLGPRSLVKTPEFQYRSNISRGTKPQQDWARILVEYDTAPEWIDELTFQFHVLSLTSEGGRKAFSLYKTTVRYADIEEGRSHSAATFLHPKAIERFGDVHAVAVEISHEGSVIVQKHDGPKDLPPEWWKNPLVTESESVTVRSGYLLDRASSPFALINIDDQEMIK